MSQTFTPVVADDGAWSSSMPNSDVWTLSPASDIAPLVSPKLVHKTIGPNSNTSRRFVPLRSSPLGRLPPLTPSTLMAAAKSVSTSSPSSIPTFAQTLQPTHSRAAIGLGHPSTSKRPSSPPESDTPAQAHASAPKRPRIDSSTIKRRTERFPARALHSIAEHPVPTTTQQKKGTPRPVPGARKRSYAEAASAAETPKHIHRRITRTTSPSTPAFPTFTPGSASKHLGGAGASVPALAPRYTSSGAPLAGPMQVQSPRVLAPTTMAGSPNFQSLDGAILAITATMDGVEEEVEEEEFDGSMDHLIYGEEDGFLKFKVHAQLRIRFAARRFKTLF